MAEDLQHTKVSDSSNRTFMELKFVNLHLLLYPS